MAKLNEYVVEVNGIRHTMLLDQDDAERYKAAGVLKARRRPEPKPEPEDEGDDSQGDDQGDDDPEAKGQRSPANKGRVTDNK